MKPHPQPRHWIDAFGKVNEVLGVAGRNIAAALLMGMMVVVLLQVIFRYVLSDSLTWSEELSKVMMVWAALLVAPWAYRHGANVSISIFADAMPPRMATLLRGVLNVLVVWIAVVLFIESIGFWQRGLAIQSASLPVRMAWIYTVVPVGLAGLALVGIELVVRDLLSLLHPSRSFTVDES